MKHDLKVGKMALQAKSLGNEIRYKLYSRMLLEHWNVIPITGLARETGIQYRYILPHLHFLHFAGILKINYEDYPITVSLERKADFYEKRIETEGKEEIKSLDIDESLKGVDIMFSSFFSPGTNGFEKIDEMEKIIKIATGLNHPARVFIMIILSELNYVPSLSLLERLLRRTPYESSYRNVAQHVEKMQEAGILHIKSGAQDKEKFVYLDKIIKIETEVYR